MVSLVLTSSHIILSCLNIDNQDTPQKKSDNEDDRPSRDQDTTKEATTRMVDHQETIQEGTRMI
jgi:hypothetical protein